MNNTGVTRPVDDEPRSPVFVGWKASEFARGVAAQSVGNRHLEGGQNHMDVSAQIVDPVKAPARTGGAGGYMVAVIGKLFAGGQPRGLAHDLVAFDHELAAVGVGDDPFATEQGDGVLGAVMNRDEVNEGVRLVRRQALPPVMIHEFVEMGGEAGKRERSGHGQQPTHGSGHCNRIV